ncbi:NAD(P)H-dependent oxidoreductase [Hoeflea prorocentri]|uniref:NAD(P)H-dependent oxidoreductase n=1 Tax=Hoeflea prorocentri TaxID=1922333 RepID=A0A9X3ZKA1_9HYPH|nr:NAD(P)H-dependent oxidoreductase [Hoeflea prorocentri]MCY6383685.1 NAD(P)H-dependent oxidoreductase [Hoeflea prorocentri]MDA5401485.1 NAD(P)H-dependent oxidoreductase [Hoeflea prorocentri]
MTSPDEKPDNILVVSCHPLERSLCRDLCNHVMERIGSSDHRLNHLDLYEAGFDPVLSASERATYKEPQYLSGAVDKQVRALLEADMLILVFPVWWFGFPALLKGWFDRVWAPGIAYDHGENAGPIKPRLMKLRHCVAVTTMGSPWWVDRFVLGRPVRKVLSRAILGACAPKCRFRMLTLYGADAVARRDVEQFKRRIDGVLTGVLNQGRES